MTVNATAPVPPPHSLARRRALRLSLRGAAGLLGTLAVGGAGRAWAQPKTQAPRPPEPQPPTATVSHDPFGPVVPPQATPSLAFTGDEGKPFDLRRRLRGQVTAVQLMFTGCSATCPIQGALFADLAARITDPRYRLLSLSIDPLGDDAKALRRWLDSFGAPAHWRAGVPRAQDLERMLDFLRGRASGADRHTGQVFLFDPAGQLVYRTPELPPPEHVADALDAVAARG